MMDNLVFLLPSFPRTISLVSYLAQKLLIPKFFPKWENKEKKEVDHPRLVSGSVNKQEDICPRLFWDGCKTSKSLPWPSKIFKVYIGP